MFLTFCTDVASIYQILVSSQIMPSNPVLHLFLIKVAAIFIFLYYRASYLSNSMKANMTIHMHFGHFFALKNNLLS